MAGWRASKTRDQTVSSSCWRARARAAFARVAGLEGGGSRGDGQTGRAQASRTTAVSEQLLGSGLEGGGDAGNYTAINSGNRPGQDAPGPLDLDAKPGGDGGDVVAGLDHQSPQKGRDLSDADGGV